MILHPNEWQLLPNGKRYQGEIDKATGLPHGLGMMALDAMTFYAGEFSNGKRHGRGFLITHKVEEKEGKKWENGSYEEVMKTAEFDNCGRVVHCDRVGHYEPAIVRHEEWVKSNDGTWACDVFVAPADLSALHGKTWKWAETTYKNVRYYGNSPSPHPGEFKKQIREAGKDGDYSFNGKAFVTVYDSNHLLFCDRYGHVFVLAPGEEHYYDVMPYGPENKERRFFSLRIAEPDYCWLIESGSYDEIVENALADGGPKSEAARIYFLRVFYTRHCIFKLSPQSLSLIERAANGGNPYAQFAYGRYLIVVKPCEDSATLSVDYFKKAQAGGVADATASLAEAWRYGDAGTVNHELFDQLLEEALTQNSEYAANLKFRKLCFGSVVFKKDPDAAHKLACAWLHGDTNRKYYFALWLYNRALALEELGSKKEAADFYTHAVNHGEVQAWFNLALIKGKLDDNCHPADMETYLSTLREGAKHGEVDCRTLLAWQALLDFDNLEDYEKTEEVAKKLFDELKACANLGSKVAAELVGDIYYNGYCLQPENNEEAWTWYAKAANWDSSTAYEKMYDMVRCHDKDMLFTEHDLLALKGTRLGSRQLLDATVIAHTMGRLEEHAAEIEQYYDPIFDNEEEEDEKADDADGKFDAWV
ncbi:MAG: hypothetical protein PUC38_08755 [Bacteroidales bacterium]|nr:hypothetical protein [Bacteroidales bacterium]